MKNRTSLAGRLLFLLPILAATEGHAYSIQEILQIQVQGLRARDARVAGALQILRENKLLLGWSRGLDPFARLLDREPIQEAFVTLALKGVLPDDNAAPRMDAPRGKPSRLRNPAPYFYTVAGGRAFRLGGVRRGGDRAILMGAPRGEFQEVVFESGHRGFVRRADLVAAPGSRRARSHRARSPRRYQDRPHRSTRSTASRSRAIPKISPMEKIHHAVSQLTGPFAHTRLRYRGANLSVARVVLDPQSRYTVRPHAIGRFDLRRKSPDAPRPLDLMARKNGALGAVNGTFFVQRPGTPDHGKPLGPIIADGRVVWSYREKRVLQMKRSFLAVTDTNRAFVSDTDLTAEEILEAAEAGTFEAGNLRGEKLRYLIGGFGWLVRDGDPRAYRKAKGTQFQASYYSPQVRRPQTLCGVSDDGRTLWLVAQEGRPHSRRPMPLPELSSFMRKAFGCRDAVFLDGGGSTQMVIGDHIVTGAENNGSYRKASTALLIEGPRPRDS